MGCEHSNLGMTEFGRKIMNIVQQKRIPIDGSLEVTQRCNLKCKHCYIPQPSQETEMNFAEICKVLDILHAEGCIWICFTGGEPFVRKDFLDIYQYAMDKGFIITLFTNGTLINKNIVDYLVKNPPYQIEISIYGATEDVCQTVTKKTGSFQKCIDGTRLLVEQGFFVTLKTVVTTDNYHELSQIRAIAEELGIRFRCDPLLSAAIDHSSRPCEVRLPVEEIVKLDLGEKARTKGWTDFFEHKYRPEYHHNGRLFRCGAGLNTFYITSSGHLTMCALYRRYQYNILAGGFNQAWHEEFPEIRKRMVKSNNKCVQCNYNQFCSQCPGVAYLETRDEEQIIEVHCRLTKAVDDAFHHSK